MALCHRASEVRQVFGEGGVALLDKDGLEGVYVDVARLMGIVNLEGLATGSRSQTTQHRARY